MFQERRTSRISTKNDNKMNTTTTSTDVNILVIGATKCGKTSIINRLKHNTFNNNNEEQQQQQQQNESHAKTHHIEDYVHLQSNKCHLHIIDSVETSDMRQAENWIEFAHAILFVHDYYSDANMWGDLMIRWLRKIQSVKSKQIVHTTIQTSYVPFILLCNKYQDDPTVVLSSNIKVMERDYVGFLERYLVSQNLVVWDLESYRLNELYFCASAKTGKNVRAAFDLAIQQVYKQRSELNNEIEKNERRNSTKLLKIFSSTSRQDDFDIR
jgi:GTPase SAR1 family protein